MSGQQRADADIITTKPPDGGYGWFVVAAAFLAHVITHGILYSFGVLFIAIQSTFGGSKAEVSWILSIATGMVYLTGPAAGYLSERFGIRVVTILGSLVSALGCFISMFASSFVVLYITLGFITGCGFGMIFLGAIVIVTTYFDKRRSLASGIGLSGAGIGAFLFSPFLEMLTTVFSLRGTLLILSGITLNCIACGLIFKPVSMYTRREIIIQEHIDEFCSTTNCENLNHQGDAKAITTSVKQQAKYERISSVQKTFANISNDTLTPEHKAILLKSDTEIDQYPSSADSFGPYDNRDKMNSHASSNIDITMEHDGVQEFETDCETDHKLTLNHDYSNQFQKEITVTDYLKEQTIPLVKDKTNTNLTKNDYDYSNKVIHKESSLLAQFQLFRSVVFDLFVISQFLFFLGFYQPFFFIPDKAKETGVSERLAVWAVAAIGISSILGRIALGYIADRPSVNRFLIFEVALLVCGLSTAFGPLLKSAWSLFVYAPIYGISTGIILSLTPVLLADLLGIERLASAFGINNFFCGIATLLGPPIAGFLYDSTGDYTVSFVVAGLSMFISGLLMLLVHFIRSKQHTNK